MPISDQLIRVAIDARDLNRHHVRGIGRYVWELVSRGDSFGVHWEVLADRPDLPFHVPPSAPATAHVFACRGYRFHTWEQLAWPRQARRLRVDLIHGPANRVPWWQPVPTIVTLHDTMPWLGDEPMWPRGWYTDRLIVRAFRKCAALITVSESSRRDILARWPDLDSKLHVIPNGVGDAYLNAQPQPIGDSLRSHGIHSPYLLYWGGSIPRKRLAWALQVFAALDHPNLNIVVCGVEASAHESFRATVSPQHRQRVRFAPFIAEADLPNLYQNAVAVLYPTLYEGFGLPVLEAQAVGTPVLFSEVGSLGELKGPAAITLPPDDLSAWVDCCRDLVHQRGADSSQVVEPARRWARQFSWDVCVKRTVELYRSILPRACDTRAHSSKLSLPA